MNKDTYINACRTMPMFHSMVFELIRDKVLPQNTDIQYLTTKVAVISIDGFELHINQDRPWVAYANVRLYIEIMGWDK